MEEIILDKLWEELFYLKRDKNRGDGLYELGEAIHDEKLERDKCVCALAVFYDLARIGSTLELYHYHSEREDISGKVEKLFEDVEHLGNYLKDLFLK